MLPEQRQVLDELVTKMRAGRLTRRSFLERAAAMSLSASSALSLLESCGGSSSTTGKNTVNIVWLSENDTSGAYRQIVDNFNRAHKNVHVTWLNGPSNTDQVLTIERNMLHTHSNSIDVMSIDIIYPAEFAAQHWLVPLDDKWQESERARYLPGPIQGCTLNGQLWAAPFRSDGGVLYYRKDIVPHAPNTWDELAGLAREYKKRAKYGYIWQGAQYEGLVCDFVEVLHGYGGDVLDPKDGSKIVVNSPEAIQALTTMTSWIGDISPMEVTNDTEDPTRTLWQNGEAIFMRNWPYAYALGNTPTQSQIVGKFAIHPMLYGGHNTIGHSVVGGWQLAINAFSDRDHQAAAWQFIRYMLSPEAQKIGAITASWTVTLQDMYEDADVLAREPLFSQLKPILQTSLPRPITARYTDVSAAIQQRVHQALMRQTSPQDALNLLATDLVPLVKEENFHFSDT